MNASRFESPGPARLALVAALAVSAVLAGAARANLVVNPSVETGPSPGMAIPLPVGSTAIPGWVVTRNAIDYCGDRWDAADGQRSLGLSGLAAGGIAQTIPTVAGGEYTVTFWMGGDAFSSPVMKHLRVTAAAQSQDYEFDATHAWPWGMGWLQKTFLFTASSSSTVLEFYSLDNDSTGPALDNVSMTGPSATTPLSRNGFALAAPRPNPAAREVTVAYDVPQSAPVRVTVLDLQGREVAVLASGEHAAGPYVRTWDGARGSERARAGVYFVRLEAPGISLVRKAVLAR